MATEERLARLDIEELPGRISTLTKFDGSSITDEDGWSLGCPTDETDLAAGMLVEYWGKGISFTVRGLAVDGHVFWYRTEAEQAAHDAAERERMEQQRRDEFEADRAAHDRRYADLPDTFKARIDRFRAGNPNFRWEFEPYEVMCCRDALKIASWCSVNRVATEFEGDEPTAAENVVAFQRLPCEQQKSAGIDTGHSGNSFGFACRLAYLWVTDPGQVEFEHGAMVPLTGCDAYGCTHEGPLVTPAHRAWYRSTNSGRSWEPTEVKPRSPLAATLRDLRPGAVHDDGCGNLYRYEAQS